MMDEQVYKQWIVQLPSLTLVQLNDLSNRIKILSFATAKQFNGKGDFGIRVSEAVCNVFRRLGVECPSPNTLRKSMAYVSAKEKFIDLAAFFDKISQQRLVQDAILSVGIEQLYNELLKWDVPVSSHTVLQQIHRVPSALNKAFPGYAALGLLTKIVKQHEPAS